MTERSLKRSYQIDTDLCVICQEKKTDTLELKSKKSIETLTERASRRKKVKDARNYDAIDRIEKLSPNDRVLCHRKCYSAFTHPRPIQLMERKACLLTNTSDTINVDTEDDVPSTSSCSHPSAAASRTLRNASTPIDWELCIFCQQQIKQKLFNITTFSVSDMVLKNAKYDNILRVKLGNVSDLIAAEGKYHLKCMNAFKYDTQKTEKESKCEDLAMIFLVRELEYAASKCQILQLSDTWNRYSKLVEEVGSEMPQSFITRRSTFKENLQAKVQNIFQFLRPLDRAVSERETLLVPHILSKSHFGDMFHDDQDTMDDELLTMPCYKPPHNSFHELVHVALRLRSDLQDRPGHMGLNVCEADAVSCVPDSVLMFLNLLYGGQEVFDCTDGNDNPDCSRQKKIVSVAQDIVYGVSNGKKWTPKHIGLACTLHQMTRSKQLLNLFNSAGHTLSYKDVLRVDTGLAEESLQSMDERTGHFLPSNLKPSVFTHFTADNIDISDSTLDGKETFHATQIACWQRGSGNDINLQHISPSSNETLKVPPQMDSIVISPIVEGKSQPHYPRPVTLDIFQPSDSENQLSSQEFANELAFHLHRHKQKVPASWSGHNQSVSSKNPDLTLVGYMPIVQAPAHEMDTLNTVVQKCMHISEHLGQRHTVITVDQALYFKLMDLKWSVPEYRDRLVPRMGGLHIAMNFMKCIGDHMRGSGLHELWMECELLGPVAAENVLGGKHYSRGMRAHKITAQAIWKILLPDFVLFVSTKNVDHSQTLNGIMTEQQDILSSIDQLQNPVFKEYFSSFRQEIDNPNVLFWWSYLDMVSILLMFTKSERDGLWDLYLKSFRSMLPWFFRYDHTNYARWGSVYLADCHQLPIEVLSEFQDGNFVVKRSAGTFNQVDPDQSQEWLNATGKKGGGIVGITRTPSALSRWSLSYNLRSHISLLTKVMYDVNPDDILTHKDASKSRQVTDAVYEDSLVDAMKRFRVFDLLYERDQLINIVTKDKATDMIKESLLSAANLGQISLENFVKDRLIPNIETSSLQVPLRSVLKKSCSLTFDSLYKVQVVPKAVEKKKILKADRNILQRLVIAYKAGREVDLEQILKHELLPVPISIADTSGALKSGNKSVVLEDILQDVDVRARVENVGESPALIIDGQALVQSMKTHGMKTFGDFADEFVSTVVRKGAMYSRVDVLFDRYREQSIKSGTRSRRAKGQQPVRRVIENKDVPLPNNFSAFLSLNDNKKDLAAFLSEQIILHAPTEKTVVTAGGFLDENSVKCNDEFLDISALHASHEEADTRIVLHAIHCAKESTCSSVVVLASDTDVLLLLVSFFSEINIQLWMVAGTSAKPKNIPIHAVVEKTFTSPEMCTNLLAFHALTGCDTTSFFFGISKKTGFKVYKDNVGLLGGFGEGNLTEQKIVDCEKFVCKLYNQGTVSSTDSVRNILFGKSKSPENMPPTSDALHLHIKRAHYQALVWRQANISNPTLPSPTEMGWKLNEGILVPILMTLDPIPESCLDLIACSCTTGCKTLRCGCKRNNLLCMDLCKCKVTSKEQCRNSIR